MFIDNARVLAQWTPPTETIEHMVDREGRFICLSVRGLMVKQWLYCQLALACPQVTAAPATFCVLAT